MYEGKPIFYGVITSSPTSPGRKSISTGIFAEITLYGDDVVQVRPVPFIMLDYAQPNFLLPGAGGDRALRKIFAASIGPESRPTGAAPADTTFALLGRSYYSSFPRKRENPVGGGAWACHSHRWHSSRLGMMPMLRLRRGKEAVLW